jgi:hypothetical protein
MKPVQDGTQSLAKYGQKGFIPGPFSLYGDEAFADSWSSAAKFALTPPLFLPYQNENEPPSPPHSVSLVRALCHCRSAKKSVAEAYEQRYDLISKELSVCLPTTRL